MSKVKDYIVSIPIAGKITFLVEAESEEEAVKKAWDADPDLGDAEWEMMEHICEGNVLYASYNDVKVELEDE